MKTNTQNQQIQKTLVGNNCEKVKFSETIIKKRNSIQIDSNKTINNLLCKPKVKDSNTQTDYDSTSFNSKDSELSYGFIMTDNIENYNKLRKNSLIASDLISKFPYQLLFSDTKPRYQSTLLSKKNNLLDSFIIDKVIDNNELNKIKNGTIEEKNSSIMSQNMDNSILSDSSEIFDIIVKEGLYSERDYIPNEKGLNLNQANSNQNANHDVSNKLKIILSDFSIKECNYSQRSLKAEEIFKEFFKTQNQKILGMIRFDDKEISKLCYILAYNPIKTLKNKQSFKFLISFINDILDEKNGYSFVKNMKLRHIIYDESIFEEFSDLVEKIKNPIFKKIFFKEIDLKEIWKEFTFFTLIKKTKKGETKNTNLVVSILKNVFSDIDFNYKGTILYDFLLKNFTSFSKNKTATYVIQAFIEYILDEDIFITLSENINNILNNNTKSGMFVVQKFLESDYSDENKKIIIDKIMKNSFSLCKKRYASTLIEFLFKTFQAQTIPNFLKSISTNELLDIILDQYGNFIIQKLLQKTLNEDCLNKYLVELLKKLEKIIDYIDSEKIWIKWTDTLNHYKEEIKKKRELNKKIKIENEKKILKIKQQISESKHEVKIKNLEVEMVNSPLKASNNYPQFISISTPNQLVYYPPQMTQIAWQNTRLPTFPANQTAPLVYGYPYQQQVFPNQILQIPIRIQTTSNLNSSLYYSPQN